MGQVPSKEDGWEECGTGVGRGGALLRSPDLSESEFIDEISNKLLGNIVVRCTRYRRYEYKSVNGAGGYQGVHRVYYYRRPVDRTVETYFFNNIEYSTMRDAKVAREAQDSVDRAVEAVGRGEGHFSAYRYAEALREFTGARDGLPTGHPMRAKCEARMEIARAELEAERLSLQAEGYAATAERLKAEANRLEGQVKIDKFNEAIGILDEAIGLRTQKQAEYREIQRQIIVQRDSIVEQLEIEELEKIKLQSRVDEVTSRFDIIIRKDLSEESHIELIDINNELHEIADSVNEPAIVNRLLVTELRIARLRINQHLESRGHSNEVIQDLRSRIIELIEREIEVLKNFGIDVPELEKKLQQLEEALSVDNQSGEEIILIAEEELKEIIIEVEQLILEELFKSRHLQMNRDGNGLELRNPQIALILESYTMDAMDKLLDLRILSLEETEHKRVKVLKSLVIGGNKASDIGSIYSVSEQLVQLTSENEITLLPLIVTLWSNGDESEVMSHWVGLIYEHNAKSDDIIVNYLDSESESPLRELIEKEPSTESRISFKQIPVEQQRYNNCGPELIENFIEYITGLRISQEEAIYVHSTLWEQSLILGNVEFVTSDNYEIGLIGDSIRSQSNTIDHVVIIDN